VSCVGQGVVHGRGLLREGAGARWNSCIRSLTNVGFSAGRSLIEPESWHRTTAANGGYQAPISGSGWRAMKRTDIGGDAGARPDLRVVGVRGVPGPAVVRGGLGSSCA
jgi:hypothetical protein